MGLMAGGCTRAGVCARLGRLLVPGGVRPEVEMDGGLGDMAGLGDRGRLLGGAGEETRLLGLTFALKKIQVCIWKYISKYYLNKLHNLIIKLKLIYLNNFLNLI